MDNISNRPCMNVELKQSLEEEIYFYTPITGPSDNHLLFVLLLLAACCYLNLHGQESYTCMVHTVIG